MGTSQISKGISLKGGRSLVASRGKPRSRPVDRGVPFGGATCTGVRTLHGNTSRCNPLQQSTRFEPSYTLAIREASFSSVDENDSRRCSAALSHNLAATVAAIGHTAVLACLRCNTSFYPQQIEKLPGTRPVLPLEAGGQLKGLQDELLVRT